MLWVLIVIGTPMLLLFRATRKPMLWYLNCRVACWWVIALMSADRETDRQKDQQNERQTDRQAERQTVPFP